MTQLKKMKADAAKIQANILRLEKKETQRAKKIIKNKNWETTLRKNFPVKTLVARLDKHLIYNGPAQCNLDGFISLPSNLADYLSFEGLDVFTKHLISRSVDYENYNDTTLRIVCERIRDSKEAKEMEKMAESFRVYLEDFCEENAIDSDVLYDELYDIFEKKVDKFI